MTNAERWRFYMEIYATIRSGDIDMSDPAACAERAGRWADACMQEEDRRFGHPSYKDDQQVIDSFEKKPGRPYR